MAVDEYFVNTQWPRCSVPLSGMLWILPNISTCCSMSTVHANNLSLNIEITQTSSPAFKLVNVLGKIWRNDWRKVEWYDGGQLGRLSQNNVNVFLYANVNNNHQLLMIESLFCYVFTQVLTLLSYLLQVRLDMQIVSSPSLYLSGSLVWSVWFSAKIATLPHDTSLLLVAGWFKL